MGSKILILSLIPGILSEKHRVWNYLLCLHLLLSLEKNKVNFAGFPIKVWKPQDSNGVKIYLGQEPCKQGDTAGRVCSCEKWYHSAGRDRALRCGQQFRIYSGACWPGEALLQHFNDTWAEHFAYLCRKPHSARMRLCPLRYIIYIKISPTSQHDFHVPHHSDSRGIRTCEDKQEGEMSFLNIHWAGSVEDASIRRVQLMWKSSSLKRRNWTLKLVQCS